MMQAILVWVTIGWAVMLLSSLVSMMAVFLGSSSGDLNGLLAFQAAMLPVAAIAIALYLRFAGRSDRDVGGITQAWRFTPGWLVFVVLSAASLTLIAELTIQLIHWHGAQPRPWHEHVPVLSVITNAVALALGVASLNIAAAR